MSSNNCEFQEKHYTQINGATIEGPESVSTMDIFRAVFIDEPALKEGPFEPLEFCGYRDDYFKFFFILLLTVSKLLSH